MLLSVATGAGYRRAWLRWVYLTKAALTLRAAIEAQLSAKVADTKDGRLISATSAAGHSVQFSVPSGFSPVDLVSLTSDTLDLLDSVAETLTTPTDSQLLAAMLADDRMNPVRRIATDFSCYNAG
jgi:hypothetical protein